MFKPINLKVVQLLGVLAFIALTSWACEDEVSSFRPPIDDCIDGSCDDYCDDACQLQKLCGNNALDVDQGETCDIVEGITLFAVSENCADHQPNTEGKVGCTSACTIDTQTCKKTDVDDPEDPEDPKPDDECKTGRKLCDLIVTDEGLKNATKVCVDGKWQVDICEGSCNDISIVCEPCYSWDVVCNPPLCDISKEIECYGECCDYQESFCDVNGSKTCCNYEDVCGQHCCSEGEVCENMVCRKACENARCTTTEGEEICCDSPNALCVSNQCFAPTTSCVDNYTCETGEYCDALLHQCLPQPQTQPACLRKPTGGEVIPTLLWHWGLETEDDCPSNLRVMSAPMVADLDGDGYPEVIFNSYSGSDHGTGVIRIVDGRTGKTKRTIMGPTSSSQCNYTVGGAHVAIADLTGNGKLDIVTCLTATKSLAAFDYEGNLLWESGNTFNGKDIGYYCGQSGPGIVDFDGDGKPEVYVGYTAVNGQTGEILWHHPCDSNSTNVSGTQYYHHACEYSVAADLDGDGRPELVGGNIAFKGDGSIFYHNTQEKDGYPAVADVTLNGVPEVAVVDFENHALRLQDNRGNVIWTRNANEGIEGAGSNKGGGPPNIANIDDDPYPEITFAGGYAYLAYKHDGTRLWAKRTKDYSSKKTGSSIFDFDGDGRAEAVYADEEWLRVYDGMTGDTIFCLPNTNATHWEYPVIADITGDGSTEIAVSSNTQGPKFSNVFLPINNGRDECVQKIIGPYPEFPAISQDDPIVQGTNGVRVFSSPNKDWVGTRKLWNQHAYSITNIQDDGTVPATVRPNWGVQGLNNFRLNVEPGATNLPDLTIKNISAAPYLCENYVQLYLDIENIGWAAAGAGAPVHIYLKDKDGNIRNLIQTIILDERLSPGQNEPISIRYDKDIAVRELEFLVVIGEHGDIIECDDTNNSATFQYTCHVKPN